MQDRMKLLKLKELIERADDLSQLEEGVMTVRLEFSYSLFNLAFELSEHDLVSGVYELIINGRHFSKTLCHWNDLPNAILNGNVKDFSIELNLKQLRLSGVNVYANEQELVEVSPMAPEQFLIVRMAINANKCTMCPDDYNKNEILRYFQIKEIWNLLSKYADDETESELSFLYKQKITIKLNYSFDDLSSEFDGLSRLVAIHNEGEHVEAKRNIMQNTLHSLLWKIDKDDCLKLIVSRFTLFVQTFEENFRAYTVGFTFDSVRKEYVEKFREYLSKINGILYDSLTRALAIPLSGLIGFITMRAGDEAKTYIINFAALSLVVFSTIGIHFLVKFQLGMMRITREEFSGIFSGIRQSLPSLELSEMNLKETQLTKQANHVSNLLLTIYAVAISNLLINLSMFIISSF